ncbi:MAG: hypothetical protein IPJ40_05810 [Saprospirales bacterium]|nr:hypothetical protein [Saprospirales bacterium]
MTKSDLKQLVADNKTKQAIDLLLKATKELEDSDLQNEVILQSAKYNAYLKEKAAGTKSQENLDIQKANIDNALTYIVDKLPFSTEISRQVGSEQLTVNSQKEPGGSIWPPLLVGLGFALLIFLTILFFPCPTGAQYVVFKILISLGAAGIAAVIPGFLEFKYRKEITAGGALAVFVLVYFFNPTLIDPSSKCNNEPFEFTVSLRGPALPDYPPLKDATLQLKLDNRWDEATVDEFGDADFKGIPGEFAGKLTPLRLKSAFWQLQQDSVLLEGKNETVDIAPNGALEQIRGNVRTGDGSAYIEGVEIRLDNSQVAVTTDATGYFEINVPVQMQREKYSITATKQGFSPQTLYAYPSTGSLEIRLLPNN